MGLFDKLKSAASVVTGGGAKVYLEVDEAERGKPTGFRITAQAKSDLKVSEVYLLVRAREEAEYTELDMDDGYEIERGRYESFSTRFQVTGADLLKSGEEYVWEGEFELPEDVNPSFDGHIIRHIWEIQAGLDAFGNDPDSGWLQFQVW